MYLYNILENNYKIASVRGKHNAFEYINKLVRRDNKLGIWGGLKCETDTDVYTIEKDHNDWFR